MKNNFKAIKKFCCISLLCIAAVFSVSAADSHPDEVYVGGMPFGVRFEAGEVVVVNTNAFLSNGVNVSPAKDAGVCADDILKRIDGNQINSTFDVMNAIQASNKEELSILVERDGKEVELKIRPQKCDSTDQMQLGVMLKDSSAGIGTVTFVNEDAQSFAGLGHGICDSADGKLLKIENGYISDVTITDICKGQKGAPGELRGTIAAEKKGKVISNTEVGVFGVLKEPQKDLGEKIEVAEKDEVHTGNASIMCTLDDNVRKEYDVEISKIQHLSDAKTKNFVIKVTDEELLDKTGGIVQGMSGSPIIQDGKLIGAITHVLINDPTTGYGIFIDNMLAAA